MAIDPDVGIPDLARRLSDDSKRLLSDEVRLAKLETRNSVHAAARGAMWLATALGITVIALVALTLLVVTLIGRLSAGHMWIGAIVTGVVELIVAAWMIKRGIAAFAKPDYTLEQTRDSLTQTRHWVEAIK